MLSRLQNEFRQIAEALQDRDHQVLDSDILAIYLEQTKGVKDLSIWYCIFRGKSNTPLQGGNYKLKLCFGTDYPFVPPQCWILDSFHHYHVFQSGKICYKLLNKEQWRLTMTAATLLNGIIRMLHAEPAISDPASTQLTQLFFSAKGGQVVCEKQRQSQQLKEDKLFRYYAFLGQQSKLFQCKYYQQIMQYGVGEDN